MEIYNQESPSISHIQENYSKIGNPQKSPKQNFLSAQQKIDLQLPIQGRIRTRGSQKSLTEIHTLPIIGNKIQSADITMRQRRRILKQAKYSSLETLTMNLLRKQNIYAESKKLANQMKIKSRKNYSITILRLSFLYHQKINVQKQNKLDTIHKMFSFLEDSLDSCLKHKYKQDENFIKVVKEKNMSDIAVLRKIFESDLKNDKYITQIMNGMYQSDPSGRLSKAHIKNSQKLTDLIRKIVLQQADIQNQSQSFQQFALLQLENVQQLNKVPDKLELKSQEQIIMDYNKKQEANKQQDLLNSQQQF